MVFLSQNYNELNNEVSALLRVVRTHYQNEIKLHISDVTNIREFKLKVLRKPDGFYKFLFLIKIPKAYPMEPMWAEPIVVCRQMIDQFSVDQFRSYKLRPLVDHLLNFCQKFESVNVRSPVITFPAVPMNEDENIANKVLFLLNKALNKFKNTHPLLVNNRFVHKPLTVPKFASHVGFYNDMGINVVNYVNMFEKYTRNKQSYLLTKKIQHDLYYGKNFKSKNKIHKGISELQYVACMKINIHSIREIKYCKLSARTVRKLVSTFLRIPGHISMLERLGDFTIEMGEDMQIKWRMLHDALIIRKDLLGDYMSCVKSSVIRAQEKSNPLRNRFSFTLIPIQSKQIISMESYYSSLQQLFYNLNFLQQQKLRQMQSNEHRVTNVINLDLEVNVYEPTFLKTNVEETSLIVEISDNMEIESSDIVNDAHEMSNQQKIQINVNEDSITAGQPLIKDKSLETCQRQKGDVTNIDSENLMSSQIFGTNLTKTCSQIIGELIRYPTQSNNLFEYILDLDPKDNRHCIILDCVGLLRYDHTCKLEIVAPTDYNLEYTFVKEIVDRKDGDGTVVRLYKLPPGNCICDIVRDENRYLKGLSHTNRSIWCMPRTAEFNLQMFSNVYNMVNMYRGKLRRNRRIGEEALKLKCAGLRICRCHFYKELLESLSVFDKSL